MFVVTGSLGGGNNVDDVKAALDEYVATYGGSVQTFECNMAEGLLQAPRPSVMPRAKSSARCFFIHCSWPSA